MSVLKPLSFQGHSFFIFGQLAGVFVSHGCGCSFRVYQNKLHLIDLIKEIVAEEGYNRNTDFSSI